MILVEKHQIKKTHKYYNEIDRLAFLSKNLYNISLYNIRQYFFETKEFFNLNKNFNLIKNIQMNDYESLPRKVSNKVLLQVNQDFSSFFKGLKEYKKNPNKFNGKPEIPQYKDKLMVEM
jgi:putative transposase